MATRPIQPHELLDLADDLAGRGAGAGRPRTIALRRSISSSYYALFHMLTARAAQQFTGSTGWGADESLVARWVNHGEVAELARAVTGGGKPALRAAVGPPHPNLTRVATGFLDLIDARHAADYDDDYDVNRSIALAFVATARDSVSRVDTLTAADDASLHRFLALFFGGTKAASRGR